MLKCDNRPQTRPQTRGNIRGGRDPLAGGTRTEMQHYTAHVTWPRRLAARVTARWDVWRGGATIFREGVRLRFEAPVDDEVLKGFR